mgnify:CR=1 FL=1
MEYGLIIDLETTGIDPVNDRIIEIGLLQFGMEEGGEPTITEMYSGLQDPGQPLLPEIKKITGLDDVWLKGRAIDWLKVREFIESSQVLIAHNADFDSKFLMAMPEMSGLEKHWACSMKHIDWESKGFRTRSLNYLAADHGFVNPFAHRALFDCAATFRLITPYLSELIMGSHQKEFCFYAVNAAFEDKDKLKARRYRWNPEKKVWYKSIMENLLEEERAFLRDEIYQGREFQHKEEEVLN